MVRENPTCGQARIAKELSLKLGIKVPPRIVRAYWPSLIPAHSAKAGITLKSRAVLAGEGQ
jgi:hypothetical protein